MDIQGLRALAVLAVIVYHINSAWLPGGFLGVDVFFVISGFIVSQVILQRKDDFSWLGFYANRVRRIVPAYVAMLLIVALLAAVFLVPGDFKLFEKSLRRALLFTSNQHFASAGDYFAPASHEWPLLHTWSLAVEMQFYLLLPLILRSVPRCWLAFVVGVMCLAGFGWSQWQLSGASDAQAIYYATTARAPEFLMGAWLATALSEEGLPDSWRQPLAIAGVGLMLSAFVLVEGSGFSPLATVWPCAGALLVIAARERRASGIGRWLTHRWMVAIGALSYSLYLWHWPSLALTRYVWQAYELPLPLLGFVVASFSVLAWLSWRFVERPGRQSKGLRWPKMAAAVLALVIAPMAAARLLNEGIATPPPPTALRYATPESICHGKRTDTCDRGAANDTATVLLFGDSHAAQLNLFMDAFGQAHGIRATVLSASGCIPFPGFEDKRLAGWAVGPCHEMQKSIEIHLGKPTLMLAGKWSYQLENPDFLPSFVRLLQDADRRKQRVIILGQLPMLTRDPVRSLRMEALGIHTANTTIPQVKLANAQVQALTRSYPRVTFLDFGSTAMFETLPFLKGELIYMDKHHLNEIGSVRYAALAGPRLAELLAFKAPQP